MPKPSKAQNPSDWKMNPSQRRLLRIAYEYDAPHDITKLFPTLNQQQWRKTPSHFEGQKRRKE